MLGTFLSGRYAARIARARMILSGRIVGCAGLCIGLAVVAGGLVTPLTAFGCCVFVGIGNGLTTPSASAGAMSVRPDLAGSASGLVGALIVAGGAAITSVTGAALAVLPSPVLLLAIMLGSAALSLGAGFAILRHDRGAG